ncbi:hypothetical protein AV530_003842 [Patagioenas fasciata monilis]|uniref:Uncharacterized protein n=1 Tax=Patagioenas fasciata monilis TaxID=372326 RepID=A0A1V4KYT6_PATFA|nr:hypothetical protein AV530_003842 [Patagioenas fasciata monilis]
MKSELKSQVSAGNLSWMHPPTNAASPGIPYSDFFWLVLLLKSWNILKHLCYRRGLFIRLKTTTTTSPRFCPVCVCCLLTKMSAAAFPRQINTL